jgi:DNA-binding transcriptional MerR regulator
MSPQYPIRAVSKITGISVDTLRAWERRYNVVTPERGERGRVYNDAHVQRLLLLQAALGRGYAIGQVASLPDEELQAMTRNSPAPVQTASKASRQGNEKQGETQDFHSLLKAIESFDIEKTNEELSRLALLLSPAEFVYKVVLPVLHMAGDYWEDGTFPIAQEHMFSACARNLMGGLVRLQKPSSGAARLLMTTPANELHEFGILSAAMLAVSNDFSVTYVGPSLPGREILSAADKSRAQVVVLGVMNVNLTQTVRDDLRMVGSELPASTELWLGGTAAAEALACIDRTNVINLEDLPDFERHLSRIRGRHSWQVAP